MFDFFTFIVEVEDEDKEEEWEELEEGEVVEEVVTEGEGEKARYSLQANSNLRARTQNHPGQLPNPRSHDMIERSDNSVTLSMVGLAESMTGQQNQGRDSSHSESSTLVESAASSVDIRTRLIFTLPNSLSLYL